MIKDVRLISLKVNTDDRGYLIVVGSSGREDAPDIPTIREVYLVGNMAKGTIRAFHKHQDLWDYFFIARGSAKFVLVDDRPGGNKETNAFVLTERNPSLLVVPPGIYHGWMSLEDDTEMVSLANNPYNPKSPDEKRIAPDSFGDVWTIKGR
jgi:dTDP-4-dehydrorhamnose 3,5-epimerase-like enzyme